MKQFKNVEFAIRDIVAAVRHLEQEVDLATSGPRSDSERRGLEKIREGCGPVVETVRGMQRILVDITDPA